MILNGFLFALGATLALALIAIVIIIAITVANRLRYTRLGWFIHRHWPTPPGR